MSNKDVNDKNDFLFNFSIIIYNINNNLGDTLESLINQNIDFKKNVELILINNLNFSDLDDVVSSYRDEYPNNINVLDFNNEKLELNVSSAADSSEFDIAEYLNLAIEFTKGKYINFISCGDYLSQKTLKAINNFFKNYDVNIVNIPIYQKQNNRYIKNYKFSNRSIDLKKHPKYTYLDFGSFFIKNSYLKSLEFNPHFHSGLTNSYGSLFINELLFGQDKIGFAKDGKYYKEIITNVEDLDKKEEHILLLLKCLLKYLINQSIELYGYVDIFTQYYIVKELADIAKIEDLNEAFDDKDQIKEFWNLFDNVLSHMGVGNIIGHSYLEDQMESFLIYLKNKKFFIDTDNEEKTVLLKSNDYIINDLSKHNIWFDIIELRDGFLNFSANFTSSTYDNTISFEAIKKSDGKTETYKAKYVDYSNTERKARVFLSIPWSFTYSFDVKIPVSADERADIYFNLIYNENNKPIKLKKSVDISTIDINKDSLDTNTSNGNQKIFKFRNNIKLKKYASLSDFSHFFIKGSQIVVFSNNSFHLIPYSYGKILRLQYSSLKSIWNDRKPGYKRGLLYKVLFLILLPFMKNKEIWLFGDRVIAADDNAEHLFKYAVKQKDNVKKYYVLGAESNDFERIKKIDKNVIAFGSFKHHILFLFTNKLICSQVNKYVLNPFLSSNKYLYNGSVLSEEYFIQHGVILHDLSSWIRKYIYNLALFVTTAPLEWESIAHGNYKYEEDRIQLLGLPRYDGLGDDSKKEILYIPTWRRDLEDPNLFANSDFFKSIKSFLSNERLHKAAEEHGYTIVFKPHPELWRFIDYFDFGDNVRISLDSYSDLFRDSSVMITDYSSIAFDFAYLKKPIIYYQAKKFDEFHYELGYFDYDTMGFGEVISTEEELIDKVIYYMERDCVLEDKYKERSDNFFKFRDKNNCKRVYDWIISH